MATKTEIYELQKKEENDFYNIEDFNNNMDALETALTEFDDSGTAEGVTSFPTMLAKLVTGNKLAVTLKNLKAGLQFVLHAGSIVNNCVTDNPNLPLSAAQGKALQDLINVLNNELKETTVKTSEIATNMTDISGKTVVSADIGKNLWWRFSDGRIKFAWDDKLAALTLHLDGNYIGIISLVK